ncbi:hypothetical protein SS50377_27363 [Spironucleus salmonicida]|uniref:Uncharacterized protein n=1 Tax=Spironucleus salmonicida TaxID=348837 RepID=V6LFL5_9EUKA|nr:hypothetical protein SS50377_27363 [Spironucleus salmonicida]|eukprot:EST43335.1 Hypothetical protein SS50377_17013 [Spironucleus salmonicida]
MLNLNNKTLVSFYSSQQLKDQYRKPPPSDCLFSLENSTSEKYSTLTNSANQQDLLVKQLQPTHGLKLSKSFCSSKNSNSSTDKLGIQTARK